MTNSVPDYDDRSLSLQQLQHFICWGATVYAIDLKVSQRGEIT